MRLLDAIRGYALEIFATTVTLLVVLLVFIDILGTVIGGDDKPPLPREETTKTGKVRSGCITIDTIEVCD